jgi:Uncharacterised nucleotidyltransferase
MTTLQLSSREELLLSAALNPDAGFAAASWEDWASQIELEAAPQAELRLLPAVYAHLSRVAPSLGMPNKLRGKARAIFAKNNFLAHGCLPIIEELSRHVQVLVAKGFAICVRFGTWSSRPMVDVDIHVAHEALEKACEVLARCGLVPYYGMTWASLLHRSALRRDSWNFSKDKVELDLHWRVKAGPAEAVLARTMWASAEPAEYLGHRLLLQSPEFALLTALDHGFRIGRRDDAMQTIVDAASLMPICKADVLMSLMEKSGLLMLFGDLISILEKAGLATMVSNALGPRYGALGGASNRGGRRGSTRSAPSPLPPPPPETAVLRQPVRYRLWEKLGRRARIERLLLRMTGPFSKPLAPPDTFIAKYDLRACPAIDQIGGPGWGWPEANHGGFWSDRAEARLLIPLRQVADHLIVLGLADNRHSLNPRIHVFANGKLLSTFNLNEQISVSEYCFMIPASLLFGPWVEFAFRPRPYLGDKMDTLSHFARGRGLPVRRLRIFTLQEMNELFSGYQPPPLLKIVKGQEPQASKFERIKKKMENSPYRTASELPSDFDPIGYVLSYPDLFEHEVDPYDHFLHWGRHEGRRSS